MTKLRAAIYKRVSTKRQDEENQDADIKRLCEYKGYKIAAEYIENDSSYLNKQYELNRLKIDARRRRFNVVVVWHVDRICRKGIAEMFALANYFEMYQVALVFCQQPELSSDNKMTRDLLLAIYALNAEIESRTKSERVRIALERKKAEGVILGRRKGQTDKNKRVRRFQVAPRL